MPACTHGYVHTHACLHSQTHTHTCTQAHMYMHAHAHTLTHRWACWSWKWKANPVACCKHSRIDAGFFFSFLTWLCMDTWQPQWIKYRSAIQLDLWPHGMKASQGQDAGPLTTIGWRLLRDKILEHDHHGMKAPQGQDAGAWPPWEPALTAACYHDNTVICRLASQPVFLHVLPCLTTYAVIPNHRWSKWWMWTCWPPVFWYVLSCLTSCAVMPDYVCCHAWLHVLSRPTTCAVMPDYMCCYARLHVLSCPTTCAVTPDYRWSKWRTWTCQPLMFWHVLSCLTRCAVMPYCR